MEGEKNPQGESSAPKEPKQNPAVSALFNTPELLQIILDFVIRDSYPEKSAANLRSVRLVDKRWSQAVTSLLHQKREPLFKLELNQGNSVNGTGEEKLLTRFITAMENRLFEEPFPTIKLRILEDACRQENFKSFTDFFTKCGQGLVTLEMWLPIETGAFVLGNFTRDPVQVPLLKRIVLQFTENSNFAHGFSTEEMKYLTGRGSINKIIHLRLDALVRKAKALKEFVVPPTNCPADRFPLTYFIHDLAFPNSLKKIELGCYLQDEHLKRLVDRGTLLGLTALSLRLLSVEMAEGNLSKLLNGLRKTLKSLEFNDQPYGGPPKMGYFVRFPVMEKLETLKIHGTTLELDSDHGLLSQCFPTLNTLELWNQTREMFYKWTANSQWFSVDNFGIQLVDDQFPEHSPSYVLPVDQEEMERINRTFPNLRSLTLKVKGQQCDGLKYMYREMKHLTSLKILVCGPDTVVNSDHWDSILVGAPGLFLRNLKRFGKRWKNVELSDDNEPSIRMLTALKCLTLEQDIPAGHDGVLSPIISEVSFALAFMKMPKLKSLELKGRFWVSDDVAAKWRASGRELQMNSEGAEVMVELE